MNPTTTAPSEPPPLVDTNRRDTTTDPLMGQTVHMIVTSVDTVPASHGCPWCCLNFSVPTRIGDHTFCPHCHAFLR